MISVVLFGVENTGNLGAVCRAMGNFGFSKLLLVEPRCSVDGEAIKRAKHALPILKKAKEVSWQDVCKHDLVIATTAKLGTDYNLPRSPLFPRELAEKLKLKSKKIALVFGSEGEGLSTEQLLDCDFTVTIPSSDKYPTLNLSHAVGVLLYELSLAGHASRISAGYPLAGAKEKDIALELVDDIMPHLKFSRGMREETQRRLWKRMLGKAMLTKREISALLGFLRRTRDKLNGK